MLIVSSRWAEYDRTTITETSTCRMKVVVNLYSKCITSVFSVELTEARKRLYFYDVFDKT